jgi:hypothetical protein
MLNEKPIESKEKTFKGFAEGRSKWFTNKRFVKY